MINPIASIKYLGIVVVVMVGLWMMITPFYDWIVETYAVNPFWSIVIGAAVVLVGVRVFKLHPW